MLAGLGRGLAPDENLLLGFFAGETREAFSHAITSGLCWPVAELTTALANAGFRIDETHTNTNPETRPHAPIIARFTPASPVVHGCVLNNSHRTNRTNRTFSQQRQA